MAGLVDMAVALFIHLNQRIGNDSVAVRLGGCQQILAFLLRSILIGKDGRDDIVHFCR